MSKEKTIKLIIEQRVKPILDKSNGQWSLEMINFVCDFDAGGVKAPSIITKNGMSPFGYKLAITMLTDVISNYARAARENGLSEGEIIGDAIKMLEKNIINSALEDPRTSIEKIG